jgi:hypothetical protein
MKIAEDNKNFSGAEKCTETQSNRAFSAVINGCVASVE